jgi:3-oxoacyl-(acyl-carrier-protein) synthase
LCGFGIGSWAPSPRPHRGTRGLPPGQPTAPRLDQPVSGQVSIRHGFKGPNHAVVTACATGAHAIGDACRIIKYGDADVMIAGGAEASVVPVGIAGFIACRAMSTDFNETPEKASRPYDKDRDGFVMGEGAGVVVLEEYEHAQKRGAKIYAEVVGYGRRRRPSHHRPGRGRRRRLRAMRAAIKDGIDPPNRLHQRPRHPRRRWATRSSWARWSGAATRPATSR